MLRILSIACLCLTLNTMIARAEAPGKPVVVATLFPILDFAQVIAGDAAEVVPLLPPGAEVHSYSPSPSDMMQLVNADLFLYLSEDMETWVPGFVADAPDSLLVRTVMPESSAAFQKEDADSHKDEHHHPLGLDPHIWLDPLRAQAMADRIATAMAEADPVHAQLYRDNAIALQNQIMELHAEITAALANCTSRTLICGGHFAFGHFANRYGIEALSPYEGFSPNAQPSPRALAKLVRTMRDLNTTAIFYEEILDPRLARVLADEVGAELLPLYALGNRTAAEIEAGETYFTLMRRNLAQIQKGLGCLP